MARLALGKSWLPNVATVASPDALAHVEQRNVERVREVVRVIDEERRHRLASAQSCPAPTNPAAAPTEQTSSPMAASVTMLPYATLASSSSTSDRSNAESPPGAQSEGQKVPTQCLPPLCDAIARAATAARCFVGFSHATRMAKPSAKSSMGICRLRSLLVIRRQAPTPHRWAPSPSNSILIGGEWPV